MIPPNANAVKPESDARCASIARLLGAHADGELDAARTLEVDDHLGQCETCRERVALDRAIRGTLKKGVKTAAPDDVRARLLSAMAGQTARDVKRSNDDAGAFVSEAAADAAPVRAERPSMLRRWRTMLPLASAAAVALAWGYASHQPMAATDLTSNTRAGFGNDEFVNQFVDVHSRPLRPETPDPKAIRGFEREVGVPVHVAQFENARFVGGRLLPMQGGERAAELQYEMRLGNGSVHRFSIFVFDPRHIPIHGSEWAPRAVGTAQVRVGQTRGYSVAVTQHGDVGYVVTSDLDADSNAQLVAAANREVKTD